MSDLKLLLEKVRTAEAGSRELDGEIFTAVVGVDAHDAKRWYGGGIESHVTTSFDAVVALILRELPDHAVQHGNLKGGGAVARVAIGWPEVAPQNELHYAPTTALALCAAFLSAKIQTGSGETGE